MLKSLNARSGRLLFWITAFASAAFCLVIILSVFSRFVFRLPISGSVELSRLFFLWACFGAAALGYYRKAHIAITLVTDRLPAIWLKVVQMFTHAITVAFFAVILVEAIRVVVILWETYLPMLGWTQAHLYLPVVVSAFFMLLFSSEFFMDSVLTPANRIKENVVDTPS